MAQVVKYLPSKGWELNPKYQQNKQINKQH
jgi:hypothetical protein